MNSIRAGREETCSRMQQQTFSASGTFFIRTWWESAEDAEEEKENRTEIERERSGTGESEER